jgi:hypothetical protein
MNCNAMDVGLPAAASETARAIAELDTVRFRPIISSNSASLSGGGPSGRCSGGGAPYCGLDENKFLVYTQRSGIHMHKQLLQHAKFFNCSYFNTITFMPK